MELITAYAHGVAYSPARLRVMLALWCARRHRPYAIVDDPEFHGILQMLYAKVELPSRHTVSRDVQTIFERTRGRLISLFHVRYVYHLYVLCEGSIINLASSWENTYLC